ncbi:MAG: transposase, partial [Chloroflexota bacterium]|nr:transposase [Chloroflexota bacterium]
HAAAYWLLDTLRRWLEAVGVARMTLETLRLRLIKIGGCSLPDATGPDCAWHQVIPANRGGRCSRPDPTAYE